MFVVVIAGKIEYAGSFAAANQYGKLASLAGQRPIVRKARQGEVAVWENRLTKEDLPMAADR